MTALQGTQGVDSSGEMGVALQGSDGRPAVGRQAWGVSGVGERFGGDWGGTVWGHQGDSLGRAVGAWGWHWRGKGGSCVETRGTVRGQGMTLRRQIVGQWRTPGVTLEGTGGWDDAERDRLGFLGVALEKQV